MKHILLAAGLFAAVGAQAQPAALQSMVASERAFAAKSVAENTRDAFVAFMDTSAVMFRKDSYHKSYAEWQAKAAGPGVLNWKPLVAELASSGDWGLTTGPWTFRLTSKDSISARGHFFTIWHRLPGGDWKFLFDAGTHGGDETLQVLYPFAPDKERGDEASLVLADSAFAELLKRDAKVAHRGALSATSVLCRSGQAYALTPGQQAKWIKALPAMVETQSSGRLLAPSGDLALVYGTAKDEKGEPAPFVRLWRHERGGWRLAVELLPL
ncbi:MAG: hypothetical protein EOO08_12560 [Chitinophagaceae bacterium]|nr:MAG: hypothetical protein EOO08_12560 [Chitinophagaceae bacterium]